MSDVADHLLLEAAGLNSNAASLNLDTAYVKHKTALERLRPFMLLKPRIFQDGDQWCALYGESIQQGVCGFGDTPEKASINFDINWLNEKVKYVEKIG